MKIIDLLNKIANGEEVPNKIIAGDSEKEYYFDKELKDYISTRYQEKLFEDEIGKFLKYYINDEVEIIEEEEKKIPEKLDQTLNRVQIGDDYYRYIMENRFKINEIIDYLKSKGE